MSLNPVPAYAGDAERRLLAALAERYAGGEFTARSAAVDLGPALWSAVGVARPDPAAVGRWLHSRRGPGLTGKPDRTGVVRWRLRGAAVPVAALQAPVPATHASAAAGPGGAPPRPRGSGGQPPAPLPQHPWWHMPATVADGGLPAPRRACWVWWAPDPGSAP